MRVAQRFANPDGLQLAGVERSRDAGDTDGREERRDRLGGIRGSQEGGRGAEGEHAGIVGGRPRRAVIGSLQTVAGAFAVVPARRCGHRTAGR